MPRTATTPPVEPKRVIAVVENDPIVCQALRDTLQDAGWDVDVYPDGEQFLAAFSAGRVACLLLDIHLPGISGLDLLDQLRDRGHRVPVIVITGASDMRVAVAAMKAGAFDLIAKPVLVPQLLLAVKRCIDPERDRGKLATEQAAAAARIGVLTRRQRDVMLLVLAGHANKVIADKLGISQRTVESHRALVMQRTGSRSLPDLARLAQTAAWSDADSAGDGATAQLQQPGATTLSTGLPPGEFDDEQFQRFFEAMPMAIVIATMGAAETIVYANPAFEQLTAQTRSEIQGQSWAALRGRDPARPDRVLGQAIVEANDQVGTFEIDRGGEPVTVDAYASVIVDDDNRPAFRLTALVMVDPERAGDRDALAEKIRAKDAMLFEIQHRVKNNLQMITSLIRIEARNYYKSDDRITLDRLEGRINSIQIIYRLLSDFSQTDEIDLGIYLSEIASSVMHAHAVEGIRLDLKVDSYPVSVNVALPSGLVANELLTNALKHAFVGREGGTITLHSLTDATGCRVTIADDGVGLPEGVEWPRRGKLGELIVRSLRQNAKADLKVASTPGKGTRVTIAFNRDAAAIASAA
ncbi:response regulator [Novosphingobium sp.]|uniref:response regulator n=1 Tax=Novosphingobium sp. TaxID=1874826 RepID=UPI003340C2F7